MTFKLYPFQQKMIDEIAARGDSRVVIRKSRYVTEPAWLAAAHIFWHKRQLENLGGLNNGKSETVKDVP